MNDKTIEQFNNAILLFIVKRLIPYILPFLLVVLTSVVCVLNYTPGTFLTGWDTLHPEFNFAQQFSNMFFGVFRTDQGLGAVAAHSHMADLPRVTFLFLESFLFPLSFLRYSYIFLCFILGPLGIYFLIKKILQNINNPQSTVNALPFASFIGALIYIFNLVVVQQFFVPFEMFTTQYAALPYLFLSAIFFLEKQSAKRLLIFCLITLLAAPMAYAAVLWYAYFACFILFLTAFFFLSRTRKSLKAAVLLIGATLFINSFWLLPNFYFLKTTASEVSLAQTNKIFSDEAFLHNKQYGNIKDTAIFKNFLFNWTIQKDVVNSEDLMLSWKKHLNIPGVPVIGYSVFFLSLFGVIIAFIKRNKYAVALSPLFLFSLIMIINMNPPFDFIFEPMRSHFALFKEGLRFPFSKFSLLLLFVVSIFSSVTLFFLLEQLKKLLAPKYKTAGVYIFSAIIAAMLLFYGLPMFQGQLINSKMRIKIPSEYFQLFSYMQKLPQDARVAPLPVHSLWGWEYYNWGYQGAGFLWFGVNQPVLARDFDRWNPDNEQYYREISEAIYSQDPQKVLSLARKYRIKYFLLDRSVEFPGNKQNALWHFETKNVFAKTHDIKLVKTFGNDLFLYAVNPKNMTAGFVETPLYMPTIGPKLTGGFVDLADESYGDYIASNNPDVFFPTRSLVNRYDRIDPKNITKTQDAVTLRLPSIPKGYSFTTSWLDKSIFPDFMNHYDYDVSLEKESLPFQIGQDVFVSVPNATASPVLKDMLIGSNECGNEAKDTVSRVMIKKTQTTFFAKNGAACGYVNFPLIKQDFGSILEISARNLKGLPIRLCVTNQLTRRCNIYTTLDTGNGWKTYYFMIPPEPTGDSGYSVHFNTVSIGYDESINEVSFANLTQIPYYRIENLSFIKNGIKKTLPVNGATLQTAVEINPNLYSVVVDRSNQSGEIALFKAYDTGWHAYLVDNPGSTIQNLFPFLFGTELKNHVLVNNWANGWTIEESKVKGQRSKVIVVFLPQYLEYTGFIVLGGTLLILSGILLTKRIKRSN